MHSSDHRLNRTTDSFYKKHVFKKKKGLPMFLVEPPLWQIGTNHIQQVFLTPRLSTVGWLTVGWLQKTEIVEKRKKSPKHKKK